MIKLIIGVLVATVITIVVFAVVDRVTTDIVTPSSQSVLASTEDGLEVQITGEVTHPGTYLISENGTLADLIAAAGSTTSNADPKAYNTDFLLESGMEFYIAPLYDNSNVCETSPIDKANINEAEKAVLLEKTSLTSSQAEALISYRESNGDFKRIEEMKNVSGIGNATFEKCKDHVTLHE